MNLLELIKSRHSIRKYQSKQIPKEAMEQIIQAGLYAPNAGGAQRSMIVGIMDQDLIKKLGRLNIAMFDRSKLLGNYVSDEQPSIIDDPTIKSGFYGAPALCIIFAEKSFLYSIPDAFCAAENMILMATELGISSCIVARGEETFDNPEGQLFLKQWQIPENMIARAFITLGYREGPEPRFKPRREGRFKIIE